MHYRKSGSGPLLIYLPGMEGTGDLFFTQLKCLEPYYTVVRVTFRKELPFDYADLVADVLEILESERADKAILVGESFGSTVALQFAVRHPERIRHLVLVSSFPFFRKRLSLKLAELLLPLAFTRIGDWAYRQIATAVLKRESVEQIGIQKLLESSFSHGKLVSKRRLQLIAEHDVRDRLSEIDAPVTLIVGGKDKLVPSLKEARMMKQKIPNARIVVFPDYGHTCLMSKNLSLLPILQSQEGV